MIVRAESAQAEPVENTSTVPAVPAETTEMASAETAESASAESASAESASAMPAKSLPVLGPATMSVRQSLVVTVGVSTRAANCDTTASVVLA